MTLIGRLYDYTDDKTALVPVEEDKVNAELSMLVELLSGVTTNRRLYTQFSGDLPVGRLNQIGGGKALDLQVSGTSKVIFDGNGQIQSSVITGTAPFSIASTTMCPNLNANLISGVDPLVSWISQVLSGQQLKGSLTINPATAGDSLKIILDSDKFTLEKDSGGSDLLTFESLAHASTRQVKFPATTQVQITRTPTANNDVIRKAELAPTARNRSAVLFTFYKTAFAANDIFGMSIVPARFTYKLQKLKAFRAAGSANFDATYVLRRYTSGGTEDLASVTIPAASGVRTTITSSFADVTLNEDDVLGLVCTATGTTNQRVTVSAIGLR